MTVKQKVVATYQQSMIDLYRRARALKVSVERMDPDGELKEFTDQLQQLIETLEGFTTK